MKVPIGESYIPSDDEKTETISLARKITIVLDRNRPVPFQTGVNALVMVLASALSAPEVSNENRLKLANGIKEALLANIVFDDIGNGDVH
jgi:hypothetical protein